MGVTVIRNTDTDIFPSTVLVMRGKASMGYLFPVLAILGLSAMNVPCAQAIEAGSNIGQTEIDKVVLREGYNPGGKSNEASPLSTGIRAYLIERAKQGGAAAVEAALSEADASCSPPVRHTYRCEIRRYRTLRSIDLIFAKYQRTDWTISVSYDRRGNDIQNVHVTHTWSSELPK